MKRNKLKQFKMNAIRMFKIVIFDFAKCLSIKKTVTELNRSKD